MERDTRISILNSLLSTPHRELQAIWPLHDGARGRDPRFYPRLAAWYFERGDVRDHKELFVVSLCLSADAEHREVGLALLRRLPLYEVGRVVDFISGRVLVKKKGAQKGEDEGVRQRVGLFRNLPRSLKTEVTRMLREREADPRKLDTAVLHSRKALKRLYALLHVKPSGRAQAILFDEEPPEDSSAAVARAIATAKSPAEQAELIRKHRIPYRIATSLVAALTPEIVGALVDVMSPQELINSLGALKKRGALGDRGINEKIEAKLAAAKGDRRVSAFKAAVAAEAAEIGGKLGTQLAEVTAARVRASGRIRRSTAVLLDTSSSMHEALEVGRQIGAMVSAICDAPLVVYRFDGTARRIEVEDRSLTGWEQALAGVWAGGASCPGAALDALARDGHAVEQVVLVTDENENRAPAFGEAYERYVAKTSARPGVVIVKVGDASDRIEAALAKLGVAPAVLRFRGDYYALTNLIPMVCHPSMADLVDEIMEHPLPRREVTA